MSAPPKETPSGPPPEHTSVPRVMIVVDTARVGGAGKGILQFLDHCSSTAAHPILVTFTYKGSRPRDFIEAASQRSVALELVPHRHQLDPSPIWRVWRAYRRHRCHLIETHGYKGHLIAWVLSRLFGVPWVAIEHGLTNESFRMRLYNRLNYWLLGKASIAVGVSPLIVATLKELRRGRPTYLIENAVEKAVKLPGSVRNEVRQRFGVPSDALLCGTFGRFSREKGQLVLIEAIAHIASQLTNLYFLFAGDGPDLEVAQQRVAQCGLGNRVIFAGFQTDMPPLYAAIDCLVLPSLSEGLPNVVLEAMSYRRPVIATRVGAVADVVEEERTGWIVPPDNVAALARALERMVEHAAHFEEMGETSQRKVIAEFSPEQRVAKWIDLYREVLA